MTSSQASDQRNDPAGSSYRQSRSETTVQGANVKAGGDLVAKAGTTEQGDLTVRGSQLEAKGGVHLGASQNIVIDAARESHVREDFTHRSSSNAFAKRSSTERDASSSSTVVGSRISGSTVDLVAGNDIETHAAGLRSEGAMRLTPGRDVHLGTAEQTQSESHFRQESKSATGLGKLTGVALGADTGGAKLISSHAAVDANAITHNEAIGTTLSAGSLQVASGRDTTVRGSTIVADNDVTLLAGGNLTIESAQNTSSGSSQSASRKGGMIGTRTNPSFGNVKQDEASQGSGVTQSGSQVASLRGDVTLVAGGTYRQTASSVLAAGQAGPLAGGDVNILAKNVVINEAYNTSDARTQAHSASTVLGGSASVGGISTDTLRGAANTVRAMGDSGGDARMQALGAANLAMQGKQVYDTAAAVAAGGGVGYKVSVNVSRNKSESQSSTQASEAVGSSVVGARNVNIAATGAGADSNIRAVGSTIAAGDTVNLSADSAITLEASNNSWQQHGTQSNSGASIGVGFAGGSQNGFTIELGVSQGRGKEDGSDVSYNNTHVSGGKAVNVTSGGDLNLKGAVIEGRKVTADVGGNLNIESLQDTSTQVSKQNSSGFNASLCIPPICYGVSTVGGSVAGAKANGSYASVTEQSGIKAGDGGFDVNVKGRTDLKGGVITSTQAAIDDKKNSFTTASLTSSDIENHSTYKASGYAASGSVSGALGDQSTASTPADKRAADNAAANARPGGSAGVGSASGSQTSTTRSGISGIAGDESVRTGDSASTGALVKQWDTQKLVKDVQAQSQITQEFGQRASYEIGSYADKKYNELKNSDPAEAAKWAEGGEYRVAAHGAAGFLGGGVAGALGAGATAGLMPRLGEVIDGMDLPVPVKQALGAAGAVVIGAAVGGTAGAAGGYNVDINNRQLHPTEIQWIKENAKRYAAQQGVSEVEAEQALAAQAYRQVQFGAEGGSSSWDASAQAFLKAASQQALPDGGYLFYATPSQRADSMMYISSRVTDAEFYSVNGLSQPSVSDINKAAERDRQIRGSLNKTTNSAAVASATIALAGLTPSALVWVMTHPIESVTAGIISAETGAAITSGAVNPSSIFQAAPSRYGSLEKKATEKFGESSLTNAGRALTKHPEILDLTKSTLRNHVNTDAELNKISESVINNILIEGVKTTPVLPRYGSVIQIQIPGGFGARWTAAGEFIGFINP